MKLQIALDGELIDGLTVLRAARPYVDIAEIGTPLIYREGMAAVRCLRRAFPDLPLLADLKIMDAGREEATLAFQAGCKLVTVLGVAHDATVRGAVAAARRFGGQVMADMMRVADPVERGRALLDMGCAYACVHTAHDAGGERAGDEHASPPAWAGGALAVAGGIGLDTIDAALALGPAIVVVGSAITKAADPAGAARAIREAMERWGKVSTI